MSQPELPPTASSLNHTGTLQQAFPLAAIVHSGAEAVDELLARFALDLRASGWQVRGVVQCSCGPDKADIALIDVDSGQRFALFQQLGPGSTSCSLDPAGVTAASVSLRDALEPTTDLAVANRFGALEASGRGLAAEMLALMSEGVPLLTVVNHTYLPQWRSFSGGYGVELQASRQVLDEWFARIQHGRRGA